LILIKFILNEIHQENIREEELGMKP